eukprot:GHVN01097098.1.p1 GENE.GHVN01097098.1~~GHVN01097098.1.p1  ORF type:complete len:352 (+),score=42.38 GHVN01097098.1:571-1626(+)
MHVHGVNAAGAFELWGTVCTEPKSDESDQPIYISDCAQSLSRISTSGPLGVGWRHSVTCAVNCLVTPTGTVFGTDKFTFDSSICAAAVVKGVCSKQAEGDCQFSVVVAPGKDSYAAGTEHGITTSSHSSTELAFVPESENESADIPTVNARFLFTNTTRSAPEGFLIENGQTLAERKDWGHGKLLYGFDRHGIEAAGCPSIGAEEENPILSAGLKFPPDPKSQVCIAGSSADCGKNGWTVEGLGDGDYRLEVTVGNPCEPAEGERAYFLQANGVPVVTNELLRKNTYFSTSTDVAVAGGKLRIESGCIQEGVAGQEYEDLCKAAHTTLLELKIEQIQAKSGQKSEVEELVA